MPDTGRNAVSSSSSVASPGDLEGGSCFESMRHLKIEDESAEKGADDQINPNPYKPGEPDCRFYLRTGSCSYGRKCKYNHPSVVEQGTRYGDVLPKRDGQPDCKFFLKTGTCKYGSTCKYHHPPEKQNARVIELNLLGLPIRKDERSCPYYMRNGTCKFGVACKFNHPQPSSVGTMFPETEPSLYGHSGTPAPTTGSSFLGGLSPWPFSRTPYMSSPTMQGFQAYMPLVLPQNQTTAHLQQDWSTYMGSISIPSYSASGPIHVQSDTNSIVTFPERPDQPECQHYIRTGSCKYGISCKYHHPKERNQVAACTIGPFGLPLRPGQPACTLYATYGSCKYGVACKFDHPFVAMFHTPETPVVFSYQRGSEATGMTTEDSPYGMPRAPDELINTERITILQEVDNIENENTSTQTSPPHASPHSESSANQCDRC